MCKMYANLSKRYFVLMYNLPIMLESKYLFAVSVLKRERLTEIDLD